MAAVDEDKQPLIDLTAALHLHSKRTERIQKKLGKKRQKQGHGDTKYLFALPLEVFLEIISYLLPSDVSRFAQVNKSMQHFISLQEPDIARSIIKRRYPILEKCFRLPIPLEQVEPTYHTILQSDERQEITAIHKKPFQHIAPPDPKAICTCMTCILRWNSLNVIIDFAHWQEYLDKGEPIPIIPRGKHPKWNRKLTTAAGLIVSKAITSPLWHARILELHLRSTVRSIRRQMSNKGNRRRRFHMTDEDEATQTDAFLGRSGPPTLDFPFHRDNYYMLESYFPNRSWSSDEERWMYVPASQHDRDLELVQRWDNWRREKKMALLGEEQS